MRKTGLRIQREKGSKIKGESKLKKKLSGVSLSKMIRDHRRMPLRYRNAHRKKGRI